MDLTEKTKTSQKVYEGCLLHVFKDTAELPNKSVATRELIRHIGAVAIVAIITDNQVVLEHQFRYPLGKVIVEIPAGKLDSKEEDRLSAAKREFQEESGYTADEWISLGNYLPAAAYTDEEITIYLAKGLHKGAQSFDEDEFLEIFSIPLEEAQKQCLDGTITDGKTVVGILRACEYLKCSK